MNVDDGTSADDEAARSHDDERTAGARYRILLPIGNGGSATLSIALAEGIAGFSKLVVLKTIRDDLADNRGATRMFFDEARVSARMNHPNVVQVYEVFLRRNVPVIVMEFLDGQPLSSILAQAGNSKSPSLELAISMLAKVLAGLHYAHTLHDFAGEPLGLIHRDVSPHNVMVTYDGQVKLIDFGIAKLARSEHQTRTGVVKGKLTYMAPEQFTGKMDHRVDIFGVGVMLWEFAARQRYWGDMLEPAVIGRLINGNLPHLRAGTDMDPEVARICARALAPLAQDRYATAAEMQADLEGYLAKRGLVISQLAIGQLVTETCAEARKKVQTEIRGQLSAQGLSVTGSGDGLRHERIRPKAGLPGATTRERLLKSAGQADVASGERVRAPDNRGNPWPREPARSALYKGEQHTGDSYKGEHLKGQPHTGEATNRAREAATQALYEATTREHVAPLEVLREASAPQAAPPPPVLAADVPAEEVPLRLFGGVTPTARLGVALAGFGTIAVLVVALGLATPQGASSDATKQALQTAIAPVAPAPTRPNTITEPVQPQAIQPPTSQSQTTQPAGSVIRIIARAQPEAATWYLDDRRMGSNPLETSATKDMQLHTLRAEADGYRPFVKSFRFDANIDITVALTQK